ncbi:MAG: catalase [Cellvibrionaceae bacterium]
MQTNFANAISPFSPLGKQAVGQEETDSKMSTLKPIEQPADLSRSEQQKEKKEIAEKAFLEDEKEESQPSKQGLGKSDLEKTEQQEEMEKQQLEEDQKIIQELSARDREVRNHERAHAAVGGQHAGAPSYTYERGPDGIGYAVGGEVSISTSKVAGNPQATIEKAQQVRRAALAPAEPSPQDRRVAASASQMEAEARQELVVLQQNQAEEKRAMKASAEGDKSSGSSGSDNKIEPVDFSRQAALSGIAHADKFAGGLINTNV